MEDLTLETTLLILTTALGLSFFIERMLVVLDGLMKKLLLADISPFRPRDALVEPMLYELEIRRAHALLDEHAEAIAEVDVQLAAKGLSQPDVDTLQKERDERVTRARKLVDELIGRCDTILKVEEVAGLTTVQRRDLELMRSQLQVYRAREALTRTVDERYGAVRFRMEPVNPVDPEATARTFWLQIIGTFTGIAICYFYDFGIFTPLGVFESGPIGSPGVSQPLDFLLTGWLIGAGSQPMHVLISFLDRQKQVDLELGALEPLPAPAPTPEEAAPVPVTAVPAAPAVRRSVINITYAGGVDREALENRNRRRDNPEMIVFHHTAMHSDTSFQDVVDEIKARGWSTGYHCVVLKDGSIHPFCRWDRVGNHARGVNFKSIGITLNGNFETTPGVPQANDRGQFGLTSPTDAQVESAARVVALWSLLYEIPVGFGTTIIPHKEVPGASTACPGNSFPYAPFQKLVEHYAACWAADADVQQELQVFAQKQYIYVA